MHTLKRLEQFGEKYFYSMVEQKYCFRDEFPENYTTKDYETAHEYYYKNIIKDKNTKIYKLLKLYFITK